MDGWWMTLLQYVFYIRMILVQTAHYSSTLVSYRKLYISSLLHIFLSMQYLLLCHVNPGSILSDAEAFQAATKKDCSMPEKFDAGIAFMFETKCLLKLTKFAMNSKERDEGYDMCWEGLVNNFCE